MAKKKGRTLKGIFIFVVLSSFVLYWFYFSKPAPFLTKEKIIAEIDSLYPNAYIGDIQDTIHLDERHVVVPFISSKNDYSLSYWKWKHHRWKVINIDTRGKPKLWRFHSKEPSSYFLLWNIHPDDQLNSLRFYLIRDSRYHGRDGLEHYTPRVQMVKKVSLRKKTYGVAKLPNEWVEVMSSTIKVGETTQPDGLFHHSPFIENMFFGWIPYDQTNKVIFPQHSVNGAGFSYDSIDLEDLMILDEKEVGLSKMK